MPVRKIPKNYLGVTGAFSGHKNARMSEFESLLEKEYLLLLDFDREVESFEVQPVRVPVPGVPNGYIPDVLVHRRPEPLTGAPRKPILTEVKSVKDLEENGQEYAAKFAAAERYAAEHGLEFWIVTDKEIRTPRLENLKFLREYRNIEPAAADLERIFDLVRQSGGKSSTQTLLGQLAGTDDDRLYWIPIIWHALVAKLLASDLDTLFTDDVAIWLPSKRA
jgi:hypothetical protein